MKRRVLHFVRKKSQLKASFIQNQIVNHIDFEPVVIFRQGDIKSTYGGGFAEEIISDIKVIDLGDDETLFEKNLFRFCKQLSFRQCKKLRGLVQQIQPDILHFHYGTDAGIYLKALKGISIPTVVSFYGYECSGFPKRFFGFGKQYLKTLVYNHADLVLAMSPDMRNDIKKTGCSINKILVHYHGAYVQKFCQSPMVRQGSECRFLIISGLEPQKGHAFLLKAFKNAFEINQNISLTIVGNGQLQQKIRHLIFESNLSQAVQFPGAVKYGSVEHRYYLRSHDVFVHPSVTDVNGDKEGIPGAIVEAMAAQLPVISTYHAGIPYAVESEKTGILVKEWDIGQLTQSILRMAESKDLRENLGKAGQNYVMENLDLMKKEKRLERIYVNLSSKNY